MRGNIIQWRIVHVFVIEGRSCQVYAAVHYERMSPMKHIRTSVLDVSQIALAEIAEVNQATVSRWEAGESEPSRAQMAAIRAYARRRGIKWNDRWFFEVAA